jgi:hypothetical protein
MAQSGYTPILIYGSGTASNVPLAANLTSNSSGAELALNYADGKLFYKDSGGVVQVLAGKGGAGVVAGSNTQVQFNNSGAFGASANFTWSGTVLAITGAVTATTDSTFSSTGALQISAGTTAQRPTGAVGKIRWNSDLTQYEGYNGSSWSLLGGAVVSNDTSTSTNVYPLFAAATSGNISTVYTSNAKYLYKPSTGELQAPAVISSNAISVMSTTVSASYTIASGNNGFSVGPVTVNSGVSVTVSSGQRWVVI